MTDERFIATTPGALSASHRVYIELVVCVDGLRSTGFMFFGQDLLSGPEFMSNMDAKHIREHVLWQKT